MIDPATKEVIEFAVKHLTDRFAFAVLFLFILIFMLSFFTPFVGVWVSAHPMWLIFGAAGPIFYLGARPLAEWYSDWNEELKEGWKKKREAEEQDKALRSLTPQEKEILGDFLKTKGPSVQLAYADPAVQALEKSKIIYRPAIQPMLIAHANFNIESRIRERLKKNPDVLKID